VRLAMAYAATDQPDQAEAYALEVVRTRDRYPGGVTGVCNAMAEAFRRAGYRTKSTEWRARLRDEEARASS